MNERLPYEEQLDQQWNDLPLPAVDAAWADMKRRLEEDDDDKGIVWWRRGCLLWGLLLLTLLGTGWWLFRPDKWFDSKKHRTVATITKKDSSLEIKKDEPPTPGIQKDSPEVFRTDSIVAISKDTTAINNPIEKIVVKKISPKNENATSKTKTTQEKVVRPSKKPGKIAVVDKKLPVKEKINDPVVIKDHTDADSNRVKPVIKKPSVVKNEPAVKKDDDKKITTDTIKQKPVQPELAEKKDNKKDSTIKKPIFFSAGLGLHQLIPIAGQKFTPYNALGRKGSLADYIPSIYLRMEKKDKWFLQAAFRYGAPQYTKEFTYRQQTVPDTGANPLFSTVTASRLKKTFYHQLPLSFNYFIRPNWSAGAGIQWNKFFSAISEKQVSRKNNITQQDSVISKLITKEDTSSIFKKSYLQAILETQYRASMPLWYLDEQTGIWKEESIVTRNGNTYEGFVRHFTYWNCDVPGPRVNLTATFVNQDALPLVYTEIRVRPVSGNGSAHGITDSLGQVNGPIPANINLVLEVMSPCYTVIYSQNIGPFSADVNLGTITVNNQQSIVSVEGRLLNCNGAPVTSGYAIIGYDNTIRYAAVYGAGNFATLFTTCGGAPTTCTVIGVDSLGAQQGPVITVPVTAPVTNAGNITACGTSTLEFVDYMVDGVPTSLSSLTPGDNFLAVDTSGQQHLVYISGYRSTSANMAFDFFSTGSPGTYPIRYLSVNQFGVVTTVSPCTVTITNFPLIQGQYFEGSVSGQFKDAANVTHSFSGNFRVRLR